MAERGFGRIVFLSSVSAERGGGVFGGVAYSAAKAAQLGFARALARELGPNGITVNSVAPGLIDTDITGGALEGERKTAAPRRASRSAATAAVADVADLITYLCREESGYITGATYDVNGGVAHPLTNDGRTTARSVARGGSPHHRPALWCGDADHPAARPHGDGKYVSANEPTVRRSGVWSSARPTRSSSTSAADGMAPISDFIAAAALA